MSKWMDEIDQETLSQVRASYTELLFENGGNHMIAVDVLHSAYRDIFTWDEIDEIVKED